MNERPLLSTELESESRERRLQLTGLVVSLALSTAAFGLVVLGRFSTGVLFWTLCGAAIAQLLVQLRCFLDIDLQKSHRDDLQLISFTGILAAIMIGGTIWITADQMALMG